MISKEEEKRLVFVDTSIFISCAMEQLEELDLGVLTKILSKMKVGGMDLVLPENTKAETLHQLEVGFDRVKNFVVKQLTAKSEEKGSVSKILERALANVRSNLLKEIERNKDNTKNVLNEIFSHKATHNIPITDELILSGMRRSVLKRAPFTNKNSESTHTKDQDCIAFESVLKFLSDGNHKNTKLIICADDGDFFEVDNKNKYVLHSDIINDVKSFCENPVGYRSPLEFLKKEFGEEFPKDREEEYQGVLGYVTDTSRLYTQFLAESLSASLGTVPGFMSESELKVCSKCGAVFQEIPDNGNLTYAIYYPRPVTSFGVPQKSICQRCRKEQGRYIGIGTI